MRKFLGAGVAMVKGGWGRALKFFLIFLKTREAFSSGIRLGMCTGHGAHAHVNEKCQTGGLRPIT